MSSIANLYRDQSDLTSVIVDVPCEGSPRTRQWKYGERTSKCPRDVSVSVAGVDNDIVEYEDGTRGYSCMFRDISVETHRVRLT